MQDNKYNLFLSGGGSERDSAILDSEFLKSFSGSRILYIPVAMPQHVITYEKCYDWISSCLTKSSDRFLEIDMCVNLKELSLDLLNNYDAIYIGGGNTYKLLDSIYKYKCFDIFKKYINNGGVYYGGSAGAIIVGASIATVVEENDNNYEHDEGFNLLFGYAVRCHYNDTQDNIIKKFISSSPGVSVIALPEKTGLHYYSGCCKVLGFESAYVFNEQGKIEYCVNSIINL